VLRLPQVTAEVSFMRIDAMGAGSKGLRVSKWVAHITTARQSAAGATAPKHIDATVDAAARLAIRWTAIRRTGRSV
jgi:hypothetical protein